MLERVTHGNGVVTWQSPLLRAAGVVHGFSTRVGGVSEGAGGVFGTLNLGNPGEGEQDGAGNIQENFRRLQAAIGGEGMLRGWVRQVHGRVVELIDVEPEGEYGETLEAEMRDRYAGQIAADGLVSVVSGVLVSVRVADCVPVLLASEDGRVVGAVHAGWRGVVAGVVERGLKVMQEAGAEAGRVVAAIGPGISVEKFEVGEEVAAEFEKAGLGEAVQKVAGKKPHVDLQGALRRQLERCGVARVEGNEVCTYRDGEWFYSHRRESGRTGRMAGVIGVK